MLRAENEDGSLAVKAQIAGVSTQIKKLRHSLELADTVENRAERMQQELAALQEQQKVKEETNELFGRSGRTGREDVPKRR
jgi:ABC-type hemin transport system substrate-binding protein